MNAMTIRLLLTLCCTAAATGCVQFPADNHAYAARMAESGDRYVACVTAEAKKDMKSPAASEDIAVAAHGRCWATWNAYRRATNASFTAGAVTPEQLQYGADKADAHLRQFELETRRIVMEGVAQSVLPTETRCGTGYAPVGGATGMPIAEACKPGSMRTSW